MNVLVCGSRDVTNYMAVEDAITESGYVITKLISGAARGVDSLAVQWAKDNNIPYEEFPADWEKYGRKAGYLRNEEMVNKADAVIAVWDGVSKGTGHSITIASKKKIPVFVKYVN